MTNELGERRDLADERDSEEYQAILQQVYEELEDYAAECGFPGMQPDGRYVHAETMRRLKAKYESACGD